MSEQGNRTNFDEWVVLELLGHRRLAGHLVEAEIGGAKFYGPGSVYCITPVAEEIARSVAASYRPEPVQRRELPRLPAPDNEADEFREDDDSRLEGDREGEKRCIECDTPIPADRASVLCLACKIKGF